jgi:hypothetical protein
MLQNFLGKLTAKLSAHFISLHKCFKINSKKHNLQVETPSDNREYSPQFNLSVEMSMTVP